MWLIYALGGGWGHLSRAVALARHLPGPSRILSNSPYAAECPGVTSVSTRDDVRREIAERPPSCLIVDTFPRGLGGELAAVLPALDARKILVHRDLNPKYVERAGLREFVSTRYDLMIQPGEGDQFDGFRTAPWLVRDAAGIPGSECARQALRLSTEDDRAILVCAAGNHEELNWYGEVVANIRTLAPRAVVRCIAAERPERCPEECWVRYWPAIDLFGWASVVVGGGGYNTVYECRAWGVPLIARPWPRKYDRQQLRARQTNAVIVRHAADAARAALSQMERRPSGYPPLFENGVTEAVSYLSRPRVSSQS